MRCKAITVAQICLAAALLTACGSNPKTNFFALEPTPSATYGHEPTAGAPVKVVSVQIPADLDRNEMVSRGPSNSLVVSDENRWGAPLDEMIERVLTQDLAERLPQGAVVLPQQPAPPGTRTIVLDILDFADDGSGKVVFDGNWSVLKADGKTPLASRTVRLSAPAQENSAASQAQAMSKVLGEISDQIAMSLPGREK